MRSRGYSGAAMRRPGIRGVAEALLRRSGGSASLVTPIENVLPKSTVFRVPAVIHTVGSAKEGGEIGAPVALSARLFVGCLCVCGSHIFPRITLTPMRDFEFPLGKAEN